ncbi:hypothetical protein [Thermococcus sp. AM4]|uniref:hypothetical protein n=1 Tax=Thermococcus sp. (strain AM4) TaxID=246969 RepID=UPI0011D2382C|nr:hypothetical protein [Thermococcus sp. AM4]
MGSINEDVNVLNISQNSPGWIKVNTIRFEVAHFDMILLLHFNGWKSVKRKGLYILRPYIASGEEYEAVPRLL